MGFGHRVYKNYDPRAKIMQKTTHEVLNELGIKDDPLLDVAMELEQIALKDDYFIEKKLYPNIDFYSGITLKAMGFPTSMFTVLFALARTVGWIAQWKEMIEDPSQKIGRPRQLYIGEPQRDYLTDRPAGLTRLERIEGGPAVPASSRYRVAGCLIERRRATTSAARGSLGVPSPDRHQRVERATGRRSARAAPACRRGAAAAPSASFSGVQSHWMNSGIAFSPRTRFGEDDRRRLDEVFQQSPPASRPVGDDHRHAGQRRVRA